MKVVALIILGSFAALAELFWNPERYEGKTNASQTLYVFSLVALFLILISSSVFFLYNIGLNEYVKYFTSPFENR